MATGQIMRPWRQSVKPPVGSQLRPNGAFGSDAASSYYWDMLDGGGGQTFDSHQRATLSLDNGASWVLGADGPAVRLDANTEELTPTTPLSFAAGSDFSFLITLKIFAVHGVNYGIWRSGSLSYEGTYLILQENNRRPWVNLDSTEILKPGSGYAVPLGEQITLLCVVRSSSSVEFYANGVLQHSATHAVATPAFSVYQLGWQYFTTDRIEADISRIRFWKRALEADEAAKLYAEPYHEYSTRRYWTAAGGGGGSTHHVHLPLLGVG